MHCQMKAPDGARTSQTRIGSGSLVRRRSYILLTALMLQGGCTESTTEPPVLGGLLVVWTSIPSFVPTTVAVDGKQIGVITSARRAEPGCHYPAAITVLLLPGPHTITALSPHGDRWLVRHTIQREACVSLELRE